MEPTEPTEPMGPRGEVLVRDATPGDAVAVGAIYAHEVEHGTATFDTVAPTVEEWADRIRDAHAVGLPFVVAEVAGAVVGHANAKRWRGERPGYRFTVEDAVYVTPDHAGRGIGRALLSELVERCRAAGFRSVVAVVADADTSASVRLHEACGFTVVGRLPDVGRKHGRWLGTTLLHLALEGPPDPDAIEGLARA